MRQTNPTVTIRIDGSFIKLFNCAYTNSNFTDAYRALQHAGIVPMWNSSTTARF